MLTMLSSRLIRRLCCLAALLAAVGCAARPGPSSGIVLPAHLAAATAEPANWPSADWWSGFGSPELDRLIEAAITANFDVRAAIARVRQADAQVRITGQSLLPSGNLTGNVSRSQTPRSTATAASGAGTGFVRRTLYATGLQASYEIDFWGRNRAAVESAQQAASANRFEVGAVTLTTQASVANTYFQILAASEELAIRQQNLAAAERILGAVNQRMAVGTGNGLEVAQQQALVDQQRAAIPPLRQAVQQNTYSLGTLIGRIPEAVPAPLLTLAALRVPAVQPGLPAEVIIRRPDVWQAEATLAAAQASVESARAAMFPAITLSASGGFQNVMIENVLRPGSVLLNIAGGLTQPVFQFGQLRAQLRLTQAQQDEVLENYRQAIVAALVDVENAIVALREISEQETLQVSATQSAQRAYDISLAQLRAGTIDVITLLITQQSLFNSRISLAQVRLARFQAAVGLFRALGGGWA